MKEGSEGARENRAAGHNVRTTEERGKKEGSYLRLVNGCWGQVFHDAGGHGDGSYLQFRDTCCDVN